MGRLTFLAPVLGVASLCFGQATPTGGATTPAAPTPPAGASGGFSIEADILGYKALESDSEAIACEVGWLLINKSQPPNAGVLRPPCLRFSTSYTGEAGPGVLIVGSATTVLANFQLWRVNMVIIDELLIQAQQAEAVCPAPPAPERANFLDLAGGVTAVGTAVTTIQTLLQLFASNESVTGVQGTIQDQALMNDVARQLRYLKFPVLMPDTYYPHNFDGVDYTSSPFLSRFDALLVERVNLGTCALNLIDQVTKLTKEQTKAQNELKQAEDDLNAANKALAAATKAVKDAKDASDADPHSLAKQKALQKAKEKLGPAQGSVDLAEPKVSAKTANQKQKDLALKKANFELNRVQSVIASIDGFVATVTGGTPPVPASGPPSQPTPSPAPGTTPAAAQTPAATSSAPPIVAILWADGLAQEMGLSAPGAGDPHRTGSPAVFPTWRLLALKALESGGSLVNEANIFGTRVHFSGGAVATYSLFSLDRGRVLCSGDFFDYGGYIRAKDFAKKFTNDIDPTRHLIYKRPGACPGAGDR